MSSDSLTVGYLWLIPAFPLLGALFNASMGARLGRRVVTLVGPGVVGLSFVIACLAFFQLRGAGQGAVLLDRLYPWIVAGSVQVDVAFLVDPLSVLMILVVTGVGFLIHVYSTGYMADDPGYARYFSYLNLFAFAMLVLVMADNLLLLFVGWEGVGLSSYLLIGFWYEDRAKAAAGKKAFIVNRIGDGAFLLGLFALFWHLGSGPHDLSVREIAAHASDIPPAVVTVIALLFFIGAVGKSAQLPLYVWLPDAMAGPTPVSALIHAATMVTAGVYLIARLNFLYVLSPTALMVVATIGALTALFAASIALVQNDIKKVLAYSTISQLGYMFLALGVGAFGSAIFHLMTHAFFKGLLFLAAGSVIHGMGGEQDVRRMGGLYRRLPVTHLTFLVGTLAIAGIPGFAGFFSKDQVLYNAFTSEHGGPGLWILGAVAAALTSFYMFRLLVLTFYGSCRADQSVRDHIHESPMSMTLPLIVLAVLALAGGYVSLPFGLGDPFAHFLAPVLGGHHGSPHPVALESTLMGLSVAAAVGGFLAVYLMYVAQPTLPARMAARLHGVYELLLNKYFVDELYDAAFVRPVVRLANWLWRAFDVRLIDGIVNGTARGVMVEGQWSRRWQTGNVQHYALSLLLGALLIVGYYAWQ